MYLVNDDLSIYATRGDIVAFAVSATDAETGAPYEFQPGDVVRMKVYGKKDAETVVLQKDIAVTTKTDSVAIWLTEQDTKIGDVISKPTDYWYEIELNPDTNPQTIIGYDEDGAKVFKLFPEGRDLEEDPIEPEDIPVVDDDLSLTSHRPVQNSAIARAITLLRNDMEAADSRQAADIKENKEASKDLASQVAVERARLDNLIAVENVRVSQALEYLEFITEETKAKIDGRIVSDGVFASITVNLREANLIYGGTTLDMFVIPSECRPMEVGLVHTEDGLEYRINYDGSRYYMSLTAQADVTVAPSGAGSVTLFYALGDYELKDVRLGADGVVYESAGDAVREQFLQKFTKLSENSNYDWMTGHKTPAAENCAFYGSGEYFASAGDMLYCIPVEENTKYQFTNVNGSGETKTSYIHRLAFATAPFSSADTHIALIDTVLFHQEGAFTTPKGCKYIIFTVSSTHYLVTGEYEASIQKITDAQPVPVYPITDKRFNYALADSVVVPYLDEKMADVSARVDSMEAEPDYDIIAWGDSLTYGAGSGDAARYSYTAVLSDMIGKEIVNYGVGGEGVETIFGRQGGLPMIVQPNFTIPADYTSVEVSLKSITGGEAKPLLQSAQAEKGINPCYISGVEGTLSYSDGKYYFVRKLNGEAVSVDRPVMLVTKAMKEKTKNQILLLWVGQNNATEIDRNDTSKFGRKLISALHSCINYIGTDKYLIMSSPIDGNIGQYSGIFEQLATEFGGKFVNVFEYLLAYGLDDAGVVATATDAENLANGRIPSSLRYDGVHLNAYGYNSVAKCVYLRGRECRYWN